MTAHYMELLFSPAVKAAQAANGSRDVYARRPGAADAPDRLGETESAFIAGRDSFYMASAGASGWPYVQHRGGPAGFVKVLDPGRLALADFRGNRQYVSLGNLAGDGRVALFFMDYARRARLKLLGRARGVALAEDRTLAAAVAEPSYPAKVERALLIEIEAFDWNCPQHIAERYTLAEIAPSIEALQARIGALEAELAQLKRN